VEVGTRELLQNCDIRSGKIMIYGKTQPNGAAELQKVLRVHPNTHTLPAAFNPDLKSK